MEGRRVKVACINWSLPDAPHALVYLCDKASNESIAEQYFASWSDAILYALGERTQLYPDNRGHCITRDPSYGRIDADIQWRVDAAGPSSLVERVVMETHLQSRREGGAS